MDAVIPTSFFGGLLHLTKRAIRRAIAPHRVLFLATMGAVLLAVHTYLLVVVNEGFNLSNPWMAQILVLPNQFLRGALQFALAGYLCAVVLRRGVRHPIAFPTQVARIPSTVSEAIDQAGFTALALLPAGASAGFLVGAVIHRRILQVELALVGFLTISVGGGVVLGLLRLLAGDVQRWLGGEPLQVKPAWFLLPLSGAAAGMWLSAFFPVLPWSALIVAAQAAALALLGAILAGLRRPEPLVALLVLGALAMGFPAVADDGGWVEAGGTFDRWIWSPGAWTSIGIGLVPGIGFGGGWLIGIVTGELDPSEWGVPVDPTEPGEEDQEVEERQVVVTIERTQPDSPKILTEGFRYRVVVEISGGEGEPQVSAVRWSASPNVELGAARTAVRQWNALSCMPGPIALTAEVDVDGVPHQATRGDVAKNAAFYAAVSNLAKCPSCAHGCPACPHVDSIGPIIEGSPTLSIRGLAIARVGDKGVHAACCANNMYEIVEGDPEVLIDGRPAARRGDRTRHCTGFDGTIVTAG